MRRMDWITETTCASRPRPGLDAGPARRRDRRRRRCSTWPASPRTTAANARTRRCLCFVLGRAIALARRSRRLDACGATRRARETSARHPTACRARHDRRRRSRRCTSSSCGAVRAARSASAPRVVPASRPRPHRGLRRRRRARVHRVTAGRSTARGHAFKRNEFGPRRPEGRHRDGARRRGRREDRRCRR